MLLLRPRCWRGSANPPAPLVKPMSCCQVWNDNIILSFQRDLHHHFFYLRGLNLLLHLFLLLRVLLLANVTLFHVSFLLGITGKEPLPNRVEQTPQVSSAQLSKSLLRSNINAYDLPGWKPEQWEELEDAPRPVESLWSSCCGSWPTTCRRPTSWISWRSC